jgi:sugar phosphate isomerase/epimerase
MITPEVSVFLDTTDTPDVRSACAAVWELGFRTIQFGKLEDRYYTPDGRRLLATLLEEQGLRAVAMCIVHDGESYADLEAVRNTVGFLPPETVAMRVRFSQGCVDTAADLDIPLVTTHIGILPRNAHDPGYQRVLHAVDQVASHAHRRGVLFAIETGQETAEELLDFLGRLDTPVGINFDGANFAAYGIQDPIHALHLLYPKTLGVHIKDYSRPLAAGLLGRSCPLGQGAARVDETLRFLRTAGFAGPLILETYSDTDPLQTLAASRAYVLDHLIERT